MNLEMLNKIGDIVSEGCLEIRVAVCIALGVGNVERGLHWARPHDTCTSTRCVTTFWLMRKHASQSLDAATHGQTSG